MRGYRMALIIAEGFRAGLRIGHAVASRTGGAATSRRAKGGQRACPGPGPSSRPGRWQPEGMRAHACGPPG
jgi:hypothetical protein